MPSSLESTRAYAQLVWLLVYRPTSVEEQKRTLRSALASMRENGLVISLTELSRSLAAATQLEPAPAEIPWLVELSARMAGHSVGLLEFAPQARAADVLGVARLLATAPVTGDEGASFDARARELQLTTIDIRFGRSGFVRRATPMAGERVGLARPARTPALGVGVILHQSTGHPAPESSATASATTAPFMSGETALGHAGGRDEEGEMVEAAFSRQGGRRPIDDLLRRLDAALDVGSAPRVLDEVSRAAEDHARDGQWEAVAQLLQHIVAREGEATDPDVRRTCLIHVRRLCKPGILRGVAQMLARRRDLRAEMEPVFARAGDVGADVLIELMVTSNVTSERRAYRSMVSKCPQAAEPLIHLLHDARWYVVRNAAELLGEMGVVEADAELIATLKHSDARVRRAAAGALSRLGTARGVHAVQHLLGDSNTAVRLQAVHGLASARLPRSVPALLQALEKESDPELQHALLKALGAHPTDASVAALSQAAQPGTLLHRKATSYRVAAIHALGDAGTPAALATLRQLQSDRDREVRATVERALAAHAQGVLPAMLAGR